MFLAIIPKKYVFRGKPFSMTISQENPFENKQLLIPQSLSQTVARYLEKKIIEGRLEPGVRIIPEELAKRFNVSKSPVREALLSLEKDGFVSIIPRIGFFVSEIKLHDIEEIYPLRASLNALMLRSIVEKGYGEDFIPHLKKILHEMELRVQEHDINGFYYLSVQLYEFLLDHCPNNRLKIILNNIGKQVLRFRFMTMSQPGHIKIALERHKRLVKALKNQDIPSITRFAEEIIYRALEVLRKSLRNKNL